MENQKNLLLLINSLLNRKIFYSNKGSLVYQSLKEFDGLCSNCSEEKFLSFLDKQDKTEAILSSKDIEKLRSAFNEHCSININKEFKINDDELLKEFTKINIIENNLPFNSFSSLIVDKKLLKNINFDDYSEIRMALLPITNFIQKIKNSGLLISGLNLELNYSESNSGFCNRNKAYVTCSNLTSSLLFHEYFHAMDIELLNKVNIQTKMQDQNWKMAFSDFNFQTKELIKFNEFINQMDVNDSLIQETNDNIKKYFSRYFSKNFNKLQ